MEITKEMLIEEFKRQIDFARFTKSRQTSPFRAEFLEFAIQYMLDLEDEIERLRKSYRIAVQDNADTCQLLFKAEYEIKRLTDECDILEMKRADVFEILEAYKRGRAEAVREMLQKVK